MDRSKLQYITGASGEKTAVILPIQEFEELLENLRDLATAAERREEPSIPHAEISSQREAGKSQPEDYTESVMSKLRSIRISASKDFSIGQS